VLSDETKAKISESHLGDKNPFFGKKHSAESLEKISKASAGKNNPNYGFKYKSDEYMKKQSDSNSKVPVKLVNSYTQEVHEFKNSKEAALFCGTISSNIRECKVQGHRVKRIYFVL
jgi:group I intron endonuclease